jgi:hypothetical protein
MPDYKLVFINWRIVCLCINGRENPPKKKNPTVELSILRRIQLDTK